MRGEGILSKRWIHWPGSLVPASFLAIVALWAPAPASADVVLKSGAQVNTQQNPNCFSSFVTPAYSQQTAAQGNTTGIEPRVGDVFYLSLRVDFISSFNCAADFFSAQVTLPNNLLPAAGGSAVTICRRWGTNAAGVQVFDARAQSNCVANPAYNGATRELSLRPTGSPALPDVGGPAGSYWFTGIRSPQESQEYPSVQLLVPVKASETISNQPLQFQVCTVGTNCVNASVGLTVTAGPLNADPPLVSLPGAPQVSAVGARVPFTINDNPGGQYYLKVDTSTNPAFPANTTAGRPCGDNAVTYQSSGPPAAPYTGQTSSEIQYGDLQTDGTTCFLASQTTYHVKICSVSLGLVELNCRFSSFTTGAVNVTMELAGSDPQPSALLNALTRVLNGHPAGNTRVQRRFAATGGSFIDASGTQSITQSTASTSPVSQAVTLPDPWRAYDLRVCFTAVNMACTPGVRYVAGAAHSVGEASAISHNSARLAGRASTPHPAGTLEMRIGTSDPGMDDPASALGPGASASMPADVSTTVTPATEVTVTGLNPATKYWWAACFDNPVDPGIEDCGQVTTFTTAASPGDPPDCDDTPRPTGCPASGPSVKILRPKALTLRSGRAASIKVRLSNAGERVATGVKLCARVPSRFRKKVKVSACRKAGSIAPGSSRQVKLRIQATRGATPGKVGVALKATWSGGGSSSGAFSLKLRR